MVNHLVSLMVKKMELYLARNVEIVMVHYLENHLDNLWVVEQANYLVLQTENMMGHWWDLLMDHQ